MILRITLYSCHSVTVSVVAAIFFNNQIVRLIRVEGQGPDHVCLVFPLVRARSSLANPYEVVIVFVVALILEALI